MASWRASLNHVSDVLSEFKFLERWLKLSFQVPTYTLANRPIAPTGPMVVYVSDAVAGNRFQGWDVTAGAWVVLG